jgi:glucose dehydrogenase
MASAALAAAMAGRRRDGKRAVSKDWVTNGGNMTNQRYSTLKQINTDNASQLKGAWMTRLKGSGMGGKYSAEASPLVKDGTMYVVTGNDDVFALKAKTGELLWERWSGIDQTISLDDTLKLCRSLDKVLLVRCVAVDALNDSIGSI